MHKIIRVLPCPSYDVESTESWLCDMAQQGLFLTKDGIFAGLAFFERRKPAQVRYRMEAAPGGTGLWSENNGDPDPEVLELNAQYHWEYIAKRGRFHIYCCDVPGRELNTDPKVQALSFRYLHRDQWISLVMLLILFLSVPLFRLKGRILLYALSLGTGYFLAQILLILLVLANALRDLFTLSRMKKQLQSGEPLKHRGNWRRDRWHYWIRDVLGVVLTMALVFGAMQATLNRDAGAIALKAWDKPLPFATMEDFAQGKVIAYDGIFADDLSFDRIILRRDWLAPVQYDWAEHATLTLSDGKTVSGGLYVQYFQMRNEALAKAVMQEYLHVNSKNGLREIGENAYAFNQDELHFPALIMRKGSCVQYAYFYQNTDQPDFESWYRVLTDKMQAS